MRFFGLISTALAFVFSLAPDARGQSTSAAINVSGQVGAAVFVSIAPDAQLSTEALPVASSNPDRHTVRLSIDTSGSGVGGRMIIPLQLRSNVAYTLSASANSSGTARLRGLCIKSVRATGRYVAGGAVNNAKTVACQDAAADVQMQHASRSVPRFSSPQTLLQGQTISLSGTHASPFNALEILLLLEVEPQTGKPHGSIELILSASPAK